MMRLEHEGFLVAGVDHYAENEESLTWPEHVGVHMTTMSIKQWENAMLQAGFKNCLLYTSPSPRDRG